MTTKPLSTTDQFFLWMERQHQPMHVAALQVFRFPEDAGRSDEEREIFLMQHLMGDGSTQPPFNRQVQWHWGAARWQCDLKVNLPEHVQHIRLPKGSDESTLWEAVARLHSQLLPRQSPLWHCHVFTGLPGGRFALYTRMHHAVIDGVAGMRLIQRSLSDDPAQRNMPPVWALPRAQRKTSPKDVGQRQKNFWLRDAGQQLASIPKVARELYRSVQEARENGDYVSVFQAPECVLNQRVTRSRDYAARSFPLSRIRAIANARQATINDVVLAACSSALRRQLQEMNELPEQSLVGMVPVSLRGEGDTQSGNQVAVMLANLGTHLESAEERLDSIRRSISHGKKRFSGMSADEIRNYTNLTLAPTGLSLISGMNMGHQAFNVVISNVPGPDEPRYWNGAQQEALYPVSIVLDGQALNITLTSCNGGLHFGVIASKGLLPDINRLLDYLEAGFTELEPVPARNGKPLLRQAAVA